MTLWHLRSKRKPTGAKILRARKKKRMDSGNVFLETRVDKIKSKKERVLGKNYKMRLLSTDMANVSDKKGKVTKTKVSSVVHNDANPHYVRRNVITRGAVIKTDLGLAKVTSRPCQNGIVNAVLIEEKKK